MKGVNSIFLPKKSVLWKARNLAADVKHVLWGEKSLDNMKRQSEELGDTSDIFASKGLKTKFILWGIPRMDIARFVGDVQKQSDKIHMVQWLFSSH